MKQAKKRDRYRKNVALITFKDNKFLLVNLKVWPKNYWKFPQGGMHINETLEQAAFREFGEELGNVDIEIIRESNIKRSYKWEKPITINGIEYVGQKQSFLIVKYLGRDEGFKLQEEEIRAYRWARYDELQDLIKRKELDFSNYWHTIQKILKENNDIFVFY